MLSFLRSFVREVPKVGRVTNAWMDSCSFTLGIFLPSLDLSWSMTMAWLALCVFSSGTNESIHHIFSIVVPFSSSTIYFYSTVSILRLVSTLVDVSTIVWVKGCTWINEGMVEGGSCGFTLSLVTYVTTFWSSSTLIKIGLLHNCAYSVDWSRIFFKSSAVNGLMF